MYSLDGEVLDGRYGGGRLKVTMPSGEVLEGEYVTVRDVTRVYDPSYSTGSGGGFWAGVAEGLEGNRKIEGPYFHGQAFMRGNRGTNIECNYSGSSRTNRGFGKCRSNKGKEYNLQF